MCPKWSSVAEPIKYSSPQDKGQRNQPVYPTADEVDVFHTLADTDIRPESIHHTLGASNGQASPGDHMHDGGSSPLLFNGEVISGDTQGNVALKMAIALLVRLGATDETT